MSLDIVKKNSSSPFQLQRSMVDQGGSGGSYEQGGFNPDMVYNNDAANQAVESLGKIVGAALYAKGKDKEKIKEKTKELNPEAVKKEAAETFKVKATSELFKDTEYTNKQQRKEDALVFDKYNASKKISKR